MPISWVGRKIKAILSYEVIATVQVHSWFHVSIYYQYFVFLPSVYVGVHVSYKHLKRKSTAKGKECALEWAVQNENHLICSS